MKELVYFIITFLVCLLLSALLKKLLSKSKLSVVKERPMLLGLSIYLSILLSLVFTFGYYKQTPPFIIKVLIGASFILLLGIADDVKKLSANLKLLGQLAIAWAMVMLGVRTTIYYFPVWFNMLITIIWIVALVNAFNLLDIMDGLCTGISFIVAVNFLLLSLITEAGFISIFFWVLTGATLAVLIYNFPPAKLYLGDSGSMLLGFIFALSALKISYAPDFNEGLSLFAPVLIVALPVYDLISTVFLRKKKGIPVGQKSPDHLAFILKGLGLNTKKILILMYGICILFGSSALLLKILSPSLKIWLLVIIASVLILLTILISIIESKHKR